MICFFSFLILTLLKIFLCPPPFSPFKYRIQLVRIRTPANRSSSELFPLLAAGCWLADFFQLKTEGRHSRRRGRSYPEQVFNVTMIIWNRLN